MQEANAGYKEGARDKKAWDDVHAATSTVVLVASMCRRLFRPDKGGRGAGGGRRETVASPMRRFRELQKKKKKDTKLSSPTLPRRDDATAAITPSI